MPVVVSQRRGIFAVLGFEKLAYEDRVGAEFMAMCGAADEARLRAVEDGDAVQFRPGADREPLFAALVKENLRHVAVAEAMGCKAIRVRRPEDCQDAFKEARRLLKEYQVPVVVEVILERVTNIAMGTEIDRIVEFAEETV